MDIIRYKKKPVKIDAVEVTLANIADVAYWCGGEVVGDVTNSSDVQINIPTLEGVMPATVGSFVVKGIKGEFCPVPPDIFNQTYDQVTTP